jgi:hypothetical protein
MADEEAASFASLPHALVRNVFAHLPVDARARCAAVCRGWAATLADANLWTRLDLSSSSGVMCTVGDAALCGASGLARGGLAALDVSGCERISRGALLAVLTANAGTLRQLSAREAFTEEFASTYRRSDETFVPKPLLQAAPNLSCFNVAKLDCFLAEAQSLLRNEPPFESLRVRHVCLSYGDGQDAHVHDVVASLAAHNSLNAVELCGAALDTPAAIDAVVDVVLSRRFEKLALSNCFTSPLSSPLPFARLLRSGALTELSIVEDQEDAQVLDAPSVALLCDALRANTTLTSLELHSFMWDDAAVSAALLGALTAHPSLRKLSCSCWSFVKGYGDAATIIGAATGALVAANTLALQSLTLCCTYVQDAGLGPLLDALAHNTHLLELDIRYNDMSEECARDRLLPAVRANTSLVQLRTNTYYNSALEAEALVASRAPR